MRVEHTFVKATDFVLTTNYWHHPLTSKFTLCFTSKQRAFIRLKIAHIMSSSRFVNLISVLVEWQQYKARTAEAKKKKVVTQNFHPFPHHLFGIEAKQTQNVTYHPCWLEAGVSRPTRWAMSRRLSVSLFSFPFHVKLWEVFARNQSHNSPSFPFPLPDTHTQPISSVITSHCEGVELIKLE